jgi:hypothetical protein
MNEILLRHLVAPMYMWCFAVGLYFFVCAFLSPPVDRQRSGSAPKQGAADAGKSEQKKRKD